MRALSLVAPRRLELGSLPIPGDLAPDDVLVRVKAVGICGTDLHYYRGEDTGTDPLERGFVMGHEFAGQIEAVGSRVAHIRTGDRVAVDPAMACGLCEMCRGGHHHVCPQGRFVGAPGTPGALRDYVAHPASLVYPLGAGTSYTTGALLEPLGVALHALDLGAPRVADTVAVIGAGPVGLAIIQLAKLAGAQAVLAIDVLDYRVRLAKRFGATEAILADGRDPVAAVLEATNGRGVDVVFEVAGAPETPDQAARLARPLGTVVIVGICAGDQMTFRASPARRKGLTIKVSRRMKHMYERTLALVEKGMMDVESHVSHRFALESGGEAFRLAADYQDEAAKVVIALGNEA